MTKEFFDRGKWIAKWADNNMTKDEYPSKQEILKTISDAVYAQYPKKEWQGLSNDDVTDLVNFWNISDIEIEPFIEMVVRKLKEKNT